MAGGTRNRAMSEHDLAEHVRKAVNPMETAPKQKHVRSCIVYSWDHQSSKAVWNSLKGQPVLGDQIPCFKALITIHKLLVGGPHIVLGEGLGEVRFLDDCARMQGSANLGFGYAPLIRAYVAYLKAKLEFHRVHPQFTGNFDYEEYLSLRGVADLNEGYQTIMELMDLQGKLECFAKLVLGSTHGNNECMIASLVPLIEESHGLYKFLTSMLSAMHLSVESADPLVPLVERYNALFWDLKRFYQDSARLPYLTSLIQIPELPAEPPSFADIVVTRVIPKPAPVQEEPKAVEPEPSIASVSSADLLGDALLDCTEKSATEQLKGLSYGSHVNTVQTIAVPVFDENLQRAYQELLAENAELRAQLQAAASHISGLEEMIRQDQTIRAELQRQIELKELRHQEQLRALEDHLKSVRTEAETWRARSEAMGSLYQKLREEHLQLLTGKKNDGEKDQDVERLRLAEEEERLRLEEEEKLRLEEEEKLRLAEEERLRLEQLEKVRLEKLSASDELERLAETVEAAASKFHLVASDLDSHLSAFPQNVHEAILEGTQAMTGAIGNLIRQAIAAQKEIMAEGREGLSAEDFYRKNSQWTNGLISAAQAVATSTVLLVETANGALIGTHTLEQIVVASNNVAAATTQLVTASRVKAVKKSVAQPRLEEAARSVSEANRKLVAASAIHDEETRELVQMDDIKTMSGFTVLEMNKNSEVRLVEKKLELARLELADHRRRKYAAADFDEHDTGIDIEEMNKQVEIKEIERKLASLRIEYDMIQLKKPIVKEEKDSYAELSQTQADNRNDHEQLLL